LDFTSLGELAQRRFGWRLFTAMRYHPQTHELERLYSSDPALYPLSGRKEKRATPWSRLVLERGEPYFANGPEGIRAAFDDADKILANGLRAVMNVPVKDGGRVLGTLNFLHEAYAPDDLPRAVALASGIETLFRAP